MLENKLKITNEIELAKEEERITKLKALELFDTNKIREFEVSTFDELFKIHEYLFLDIYDFEGKIRKNISKGNFRFASTLYLQDVLAKIDIMLQDNFDDIIKKYVEMNVAHLFREWNGRGTHIWIDMM
jgi:cell filamentation protein